MEIDKFEPSDMPLSKKIVFIYTQLQKRPTC